MSSYKQYVGDIYIWLFHIDLKRQQFSVQMKKQHINYLITKQLKIKESDYTGVK